MISLLLAAAIVAVFGRALHGEFLFDDPAIKDMEPKFQRGSYLKMATLHPRYPRAFTHVVYTCIYRLAGFRPWAWHGVNLALHLLNVLMFWQLAGLFLSPGRALLAAAIFAVHPLSAWVCYVSAMADLLSVAFALAAYLALLAGFWPLAALAHILSIKGKQTGWLYLAGSPILYAFCG